MLRKVFFLNLTFKGGIGKVSHFFIQCPTQTTGSRMLILSEINPLSTYIRPLREDFLKFDHKRRKGGIRFKFLVNAQSKL